MPIYCPEMSRPCELWSVIEPGALHDLTLLRKVLHALCCAALHDLPADFAVEENADHATLMPARILVVLEALYALASAEARAVYALVTAEV